MRLADPTRSKAVLVGSAHYEDRALDDIPAVATNVADLAAILTDPDLAGFPPEHVHTLVDPDAKAGRTIARWCQDTEDVLLVYFAGHGLVDNAGRLLLALTDTEYDVKEHSALPIDQLHTAIANSNARIRILVLDCCYSGRALAKPMADNDSRLIGQIDVEGTYALASAPRNLVSLYVPGERHTVFSGELISLLREGVPDDNPLLPLPSLHHRLTIRLRARDRPTPKVLHTDTVAEFALVRNRGYRPKPPVPPRTPTPRSTRLRTPAEADGFAQAAAADIDASTEADRRARDRSLDTLSAAVSDPSWPVLARLRFAWMLADFGETDRAAAALYALGAAYHRDVVANVRNALAALADDEDWARKTGDRWDVAGLVRRDRHLPDFDPKDLWGTAMAMLLAAAGLPTPVRIQALEELAGLGHRDEAVRIARGMLRERRARDDLKSAVTRFLG